MFTLCMTLLVIRMTSDIPDGAGGHPNEKPPDLDAENRRNYATAFYWEMYGALDATYKMKLSGGRLFARPAGATS